MTIFYLSCIIIYIICSCSCLIIASIDSNDNLESTIVDFDPYDLHPRNISLPTFSYHTSSTSPSKGHDTSMDDVDADGWWEVKYSGHYVFDKIRKHQKLFIRRSDTDVNMIHSCYEYKTVLFGNDKLISDSSTFCYPSIIITGVPKCSTSAMFALLSSAPFISSNPIKENCLFVTGGSILTYFASLPKNIPQQHYYIDGCIDVVGNMMLRRILRNPNTFYIVMVRNYVDMIWSAYNYWCDPKQEVGCDPGSLWADPDYHKRSPELFHDIVTAELSHNTSSGLIIPPRIRSPCSLATNIYQSYIQFLWSHVPSEATIIIASEQLESEPAVIWSRLVIALGFPSNHIPNFQSFTKVRYNTQVQAERGADVTIDMHSYSPGKYPISGNRQILSTSRQLIDQYWHEDCQFISSKTGFQYHACRDKPTASNISALMLSTPYISPLVPTNKLDSQILTELRFTGYLRRHLRTCFSTYAISSSTGARPLQISSSNSGDQQFRRNLRDILPMPSTSTLLIADDPAERDYLRGILRFVYQQDVTWDVEVDHSRSWVSTTCMTAKVVMSSMMNVESNDQGIFTIKTNLSLSQDNPCQQHQFHRIVLTAKDIYYEAWNIFMQQYSTNFNDQHFDNSIAGWNLWDEHVGTFIEQMKTQLLSTHAVDAIHHLNAANKFFLVPMHLLTGNRKVDILHRLLDYLHMKTSSATSSSSMIRVNHSHASCIFSLARTMYLDFRIYLHGRHYLTPAYASKGLLCLLQHSYRQQQLVDYLSFTRSFECIPRYDNSARIQIPSSDMVLTATTLDSNAAFIDVWRCDMRYHRRHFLEKINHHVIAIIAAPGSDLINTRLLFEHATGYHTGAADSNSTLSVFGGEFACGQRLGLIHVRSSATLITLTRGITPAIRLHQNSRKKCLKGMVRGFTRAIVLVKDPFLYIYEKYLEYRNLTSMSTTTSNHIDMHDWQDVAVAIASNFTDKWLNTYRVYEEMSTTFNETNVFVVSQSALIYAEHPGSPRTPGIDRYKLLSSMITFSGHEQAMSIPRLHCAYSFLSLEENLLELDVMLGLYLPGGKGELICKIRDILSTRLPTRLLIHHIFWAYPCP